MTPTTTLALDVEAFPAHHPQLDPLLARFARAALGRHGASPRELRALRNGDPRAAIISFAAPDPRTEATYEADRITEFGAIVLAALLLHAWEEKRVTRVCARGGKVDYFVGCADGDQRWILEVGGTDRGNHSALRRAKLDQLRQSLYRRPPFRMGGFVAATRLADPGITSLDGVPAEAT
ncbi:MAG: hypothetical protein IT373_04495 [Polyangiaceae bacterium]|nr:hypothetical protein [Polyangiaceae bacterium]